MGLTDLSGPVFLDVYFGLILVAMLAAIPLRWLMSGPHAAPEPRDLDLDPYELAVLSQGMKGAVQVAIFSLVQRGMLSFDEGAEWLTRSRRLDATAYPVERELYERVGEGRLTILEADEVARGTLSRSVGRLLERRLVLGAKAQLVAQIVSSIPIVALLAVLAARLPVGIVDTPHWGDYRHNFRALVIVVVLLHGVGIALLLLAPIRRSIKGARVLALLQEQHASLRQTLESHALDKLNAKERVFGLALFGIATLVGSELEPLLFALNPIPKGNYFDFESGGSYDPRGLGRR